MYIEKQIVTPTEDDHITSEEYQRLLSIIVGTVIGVGVAFIVISMTICSVIALFFQHEKGQQFKAVIKLVKVKLILLDYYKKA